MNPLQMVKDLIESKLKDSLVQVGDMTGTLDHLDILVVSDEFKGKMLIDQHQIVMDILREPLKDQIHAVKIKTITKEKYNKLQG